MHTPARWPDIAIPTLTLDEAYRVLGHTGTSITVDTEELQQEIWLDIDKRRGALEKVLLERSTQVILDGGTAATLFESMREYMTPSGIRITVATDRGVNRYPGSPQKPNEDRIVIDTGVDFAAVIDGVGGHADGDKAAHILAESMQRTRGEIPTSVSTMQERMVVEHVDPMAGACFVNAQVIWDLDGNPSLNAMQAGDVRLLVLNENNTVAFESSDEDLVGGILLANNLITEDQSHFHRARNVVAHMLSQTSGLLTYTCNDLPLQSGQRVILMSDGITDNILTEELLPLIQGKSTAEIVQVVSNITQARMEQHDKIISRSLNRYQAGHYSDGFKTTPKRDNRTIAILEIPHF